MIDMSGSSPSGASAPQMTLDQLAAKLSTRMLVNEVLCVGAVALSMFVLWYGQAGTPLGSALVVLAGAIVIARAWNMAGRTLSPVPTDTSTDPAAAAKQLTDLANRMMRLMMLPTGVGLLASLVSWGWQPVFFGALISIAGFTFFGPSRTRLAAWRDKLENAGGKTGL
ncbi:MAG: hypothetical protein ACOC96_00820 [Actinomycetota bacterium]